MKPIVLDASALLALINKELGYAKVEACLQHAIISSVNVTEVASVLTEIGMPIAESKKLVFELVSDIIDFDHELAFMAAELRKITKPYGLSLGDRACLALGLKLKHPVLTADKSWTHLKIGINIELIR